MGKAPRLAVPTRTQGRRGLFANPGGAVPEQLRAIRCPTVRVGTRPHPRDALLPAVVMDQAARRRLAAETGVARRSLERAFRAQPGRGVNAELWRKRLERCCELLKTTDLTIVDIAPLVGFHSADYLHAAFRKAFDTTPRKWRLAQRNAE